MLDRAWAALLTLHRRAHLRGLLPRAPLPSPTVALGALRAGGSGKTPAARWLALRALQHGLIAVVLSPGYRPGQPSAPPRLIHDSRAPSPPSLATLAATARASGDEAAEALHRLTRPPFTDVTTGRLLWIAGRDRRAAFQLARAHLDRLPDLVLLDDGLHHHRVAPHHTVALLGPGDLTARLLPCGPLREGPALLDRVDLVWFHAPTPHSAPEAANATVTSTWLPDAPPPEGPHLLLCATGAPARVLASARQQGIDVRDLVALRDHHPYPDRLLREVSARCRRRGLLPLTTLKDYVKIAARWDRLSGGTPLSALSGDLQVLSGAERLDALLRTC